jgi:ribosomal protein L28
MKMTKLSIHDVCVLCAKMPQMGMHKPHSLQRTKKIVRPNLGKWSGLNVCARCRKTMAKTPRVRKVQPAQPVEA